MTPALSLTEDDVFVALQSFLLAILPTGIEVVRGQDNRVPEPKGVDFVTMTPILRERLATNIVHFIDGFPADPGARMDLQPVKVTIQLDVHGTASADNTQIITTLFRSDYATEYFQCSGFSVAPLYTSEPHQMPFSDGEQQIEARWVVDVVMQANPVVTTSQDFAAALTVGIVSVEEKYPQ